MKIQSLKKSNVNIKHLERDYHIHLPEDYKNFLEKYNGAISQDETSVYIQQLNDSVEIDSLLGYQVDKEWLDIEAWMEEYGDDLPANAIVFAKDISDNLFILINDSESLGVYYWDVQYSFAQSTETSNAYYVCKDFTEFCKLINGMQEE